MFSSCYFGESCFVHFSKEKCCMRGDATRGGCYFYCHCHCLGFGFGIVSALPCPASPFDPKGSVVVVSFRREKAARPSLRGPDELGPPPPQCHDFPTSSPAVNNKSSCACQSLFERLPLADAWVMGNEKRGAVCGRLAAAIVSGLCGGGTASGWLWWGGCFAATQLKRKKKAHFSFNFRACQLKMPTFIYKRLENTRTPMPTICFSMPPPIHRTQKLPTPTNPG